MVDVPLPQILGSIEEEEACSFIDEEIFMRFHCFELAVIFPNDSEIVDVLSGKTVLPTLKLVRFASDQGFLMVFEEIVDS